MGMRGAHRLPLPPPFQCPPSGACFPPCLAPSIVENRWEKRRAWLASPPLAIWELMMIFGASYFLIDPPLFFSLRCIPFFLVCNIGLVPVARLEGTSLQISGRLPILETLVRSMFTSYLRHFSGVVPSAHTPPLASPQTIFRCGNHRF